MIERAPRSRSFTVLDNQVLNDPALSWGAKGLLAFILSKPDHWRTDRDHLARQGPDGEKTVRGLLRELEAAGYLTRQRHRDPRGRIRWKRVVHELAVPPQQRTARPAAAAAGGAIRGGAATGAASRQTGKAAATSSNAANPQVAPLAGCAPVVRRPVVTSLLQVLNSKR